MDAAPDEREDRDDDGEDQRYMAVFEEPWREPDPDAGRYTIAVEWTFRVAVRGDRYQEARRYVADTLLPAAIMTIRGGLDRPGDFLDRGAILWDYVPGEEDDEG